MTRELHLRNRQRSRTLDLRLFRKIILSLLDELHIARFELGIHFVNDAEMTRINEKFLQHEGSTDVITFDHSSLATRHSSPLHGEIFICVDEAVVQARRFRATVQTELIRYAVHGILHLLGHDDKRAAARIKMKREENRLVRRLTARFGNKSP